MSILSNRFIRIRAVCKDILSEAAGLILLVLIRIRLSLSETGAERLARSAAWLASVAIPSRRRIASRNLQLALGNERTPQELTRILHEAYRHTCRVFSEIVPLLNQPLSHFNNRIRVEGLDNLTRAHAQGHGVIAVSGHYGAFPLLGPALASQGFTINWLYRPPKGRTTARIFDQWFARAGCRLIVDTPRHLAGLRCLQALSGGALVGILIDQHYPAGIQIPFFGHPAKTGIGAALLATRSQAPLVPMVLRRLPDGGYLLKIEPALPPPANRSREALTACMTELTRRVEEWIREEPSQWFWIHRRWKNLEQGP